MKQVLNEKAKNADVKIFKMDQENPVKVKKHKYKVHTYIGQKKFELRPDRINGAILDQTVFGWYHHHLKNVFYE